MKLISWVTAMLIIFFLLMGAWEILIESGILRQIIVDIGRENVSMAKDMMK